MIIVGGEGRGISQPVLKALRPGFDHFVYVPMLGSHTSLNAATALAIALYDYRRAWPGSGGGGGAAGEEEEEEEEEE